MTNIGFIGCGNMGSALIRGIVNSKNIQKYSLCAYDASPAALQRAESLGVRPLRSCAETAENSDYLFLMVKPQQLDTVLEEIASSITENTVLVSVCAGISDEYIAGRTLENARVVLAMPNTPLLLGEGATALARNDAVTDEEFRNICGIFGACGEYAVLPKTKMKEIIAVNGSAPAFIYLYAKSFIDYAVSVGIDPDAAKSLFAKTLIGSAKMITDSGNTIERLIEMVSSPGGTTIAGLEKLREGELEETVQRCCKACTQRAYELGE